MNDKNKSIIGGCGIDDLDCNDCSYGCKGANVPTDEYTPCDSCSTRLGCDDCFAYSNYEADN